MGPSRSQENADEASPAGDSPVILQAPVSGFASLLFVEGAKRAGNN